MISSVTSEISGGVQISLLGPLRVRRVDGTDVDPADWGTGKTVDLLRLLALSAGRPMAVSTILDALWPDVDHGKGLASLRTALCRIRRVIGQDCIARQYDA